MQRSLRYSKLSYANLKLNQQHAFAQRQALNIYPSDSVYSFIPKNGCSTMRTTLAIANGCIDDASDFNWIHQNNETFSASLADLAKAKYTFTILRCPFSRLLSVYLDKFLERNPVAWKYIELHKRKIEMEDITFEFFVKSMCKTRIRNADIHWMPQINFLVYEQYDDYFPFEEFPRLTQELQQKMRISGINANLATNLVQTAGCRRGQRHGAITALISSPSGL